MKIMSIANMMMPTARSARRARLSSLFISARFGELSMAAPIAVTGPRLPEIFCRVVPAGRGTRGARDAIAALRHCDVAPELCGRCRRRCDASLAIRDLDED